MAVSPAGTESPVVLVGDDDALVFTVQDLGQQTVRIMKQIEETGKPAVITRDGRFIAVITPLAPGQAESVALRELARLHAKGIKASLLPPG